MASDSKDNPYQPPQAELEASPALRLPRIEKSLLLLPRNWESPPVCLLSGKTHDLLPVRHLKHLTVWPGVAVLLLTLFFACNHPPLPVFFSVIAGVVLLSSFVRPRPWPVWGRGHVSYFLSKSLRRRQKWQTNLRIVLMAAALLVHNADLNGFAPWLVFGPLALSRLIAPRFFVMGMNEEVVWLSGVPAEAMETIVKLDAARSEKIGALDSQQPEAPVSGQTG